MSAVIYVIGFCVFIARVFAQEGARIIELTDDGPSIIWTPTSSETIELQAEVGYQIQIDVTTFDVDGKIGDSVTVKSISDDDEDANEMMFTYVVSGKPRYLYNNNNLQANYNVGTNTSNTVVIQFTRVGEALTTTTIIPTTSVEPMPTPAIDEEATLTVHLYGRPAESFNEPEIRYLKEAIGKMGTEYCQVQNCPLNESITWRNVKIELLQQCSVMWEDYDACVILTFALPIIKLEERQEKPLWQGYQLNEAHLKILWKAYASKYLDHGLSLYAVPDLNIIFKFRIIIIFLVIVLLIILVLSVRHLGAKLHKKRRRLSDTISIMDRTSDRISQQSLPPHYLQELPPHFTRTHIGNYSDYNMAFAEDEDDSMPQPIGNQISKDSIDMEDAHA